MAGNVRRRLAGLVAGGATGVLLAGCSVNVPDPAAPAPMPSVSTLATPTITPGHDAAAVAGKDLPLAAGGTLAPGEPVTVSTRLEEVPGWSVVHSALQGENRYKKTDGCTFAVRVSVNQGPLVVAGDDAASTKELFSYLKGGALDGLKPASLRWGEGSDKPQRSVEFLGLESSAAVGGKPALVLARLFSAPASSVYISLSCPDDATFNVARTEALSRLVVVPPS
ncbi:hypothetical protein [Paenarthrobacter aurescens]|uniref:Lipoprotein n=1 Tax=Paenarthrobacter aurescens TaxID=43663 RepID=A0A4Y3NAZ5_PAEAU|nr:hypothetical protein [Paenarthrobacter aurescens]MDO6144135.1 hypothetical protein [Paenarthrobacter aurescens]MDO6147982.1 hypothetical protein [Paenarthrobacter aurescens]MDO6159226.1 hypothetical protein [Paenarthrobacter aurescens]MDO6163210.1 hypothetical protein [Paenarthrobacter aurescens]GEB18307.1 hypothetical protein AAU01_10620 [Paenarthrobacter aurescens]